MEKGSKRIEGIGKPGLGVSPLLPRLVDGDVQDGGNLRVPKAGEVVQLDHLSQEGLFLRQPGQRLGQGEKSVVRRRRRVIRQLDALPTVAAFLALVAPGLIDQDSP